MKFAILFVIFISTAFSKETFPENIIKNTLAPELAQAIEDCLESSNNNNGKGICKKDAAVKLFNAIASYESLYNPFADANDPRMEPTEGQPVILSAICQGKCFFGSTYQSLHPTITDTGIKQVKCTTKNFRKKTTVCHLSN